MTLLIDILPLQRGGPEAHGPIADLVRAALAQRADRPVRVLIDRQLAQRAPAQTLLTTIPGCARIWSSPRIDGAFATPGSLARLSGAIRAEVVVSERPGTVLVAGLPDENALGSFYQWPDDLPEPNRVIVLGGDDADAVPSASAQRFLAASAGIVLVGPMALPNDLSVPVLDLGNGTDAENARLVLDFIATLPLPVTRPAAPAEKPRLAMVSPLPPQHTGIADYTRDVITALAPHYAVTAVSEIEPAPEVRTLVTDWMSSDRFAGCAWDFDRVVYQIGNSPFHQFEVEHLLPACPGLVVLHDVTLADYRWAYADAIGRPQRNLDDVEAAHGYAALVEARQRGIDVSLPERACSAPVISAAMGVIVHSEFARNLVRKHHGEALLATTRVIPHVCVHKVLPDRATARRMLGIAEDAFLVCTFGEVGRKKHPLDLLEGWIQAFGDAADTAELRYVGKAHDGFDRMIALRARAVGKGARVAVTGRVEADEYDAWMAACDLAVQLRSESIGESSGAVIDCLGADVPLIVNRHGSFAELPDDVVAFVAEDADAGEIADLMRALRASYARRAAMIRAAHAHVDAVLSPQRIGVQTRLAIEAAYADGPLAAPTRIVRRFASAEAGLSPTDRIALTNALAETWPMVRQPALMLELSETAADAPDAAIWTSLLGASTARFRVEPFERIGARFVSARHRADALFATSVPTGEIELWPQSGDLIVLAAKPPVSGIDPALTLHRANGVALWQLVDTANDDTVAAIARGDWPDGLDGVICPDSASARWIETMVAALDGTFPVLASDRPGWIERLIAPGPGTTNTGNG